MQTNYQSKVNHQQSNQNRPIDKGRACVIVERYPSNQLGQNHQPLMKNRYANIGRATLWQNKPGSNMPNVEIELDTMPIGAQGSQKIYIFWDSDKSNNQ
jgi:hypothetical protein